MLGQLPKDFASQQLEQSLTVPPSAEQAAASGSSWHVVRPSSATLVQVTNPESPQTERAVHRRTLHLHLGGSAPVATRSLATLAAHRT
jgi:hypothetical protein